MKESTSNSSEIKRTYKGQSDGLADLAIDLYALLGKWSEKHPEYGYAIHLSESLHLTINKKI